MQVTNLQSLNVEANEITATPLAIRPYRQIFSRIPARQTPSRAECRGPCNTSACHEIVATGLRAVWAWRPAALKGGFTIEVPSIPGRMDASQEQADVAAFALLEPVSDGFRNYAKASCSVQTEVLLLDRAQLLTLMAPEMTVLLGGLRVLGANTAGLAHGVFTSRAEVLSNDFFVNLLDMGTQWMPDSRDSSLFIGSDRKTGSARWTATRADLVFGSNAQLRAVAEVYASSDAKRKFVNDFISAWTKVMELDRFDTA